MDGNQNYTLRIPLNEKVIKRIEEERKMSEPLSLLAKCIMIDNTMMDLREQYKALKDMKKELEKELEKFA